MPDTKITLTQLQHLAKLARIKLTSKEEAIYLPQIESILEYIEVLNQADTENVIPTYQITGLKNILRSDEVKPSLDSSSAISSAKKTSAGFIVVPNTIKK